MTAEPVGLTRALVAHPFLGASGARDPELALAEAAGLAEALGLEIAAQQIVPVRKLRAGTLFGTGQVGDLADRVSEVSAGLVIVDAALTPVQQRNLERDLGVKVLDRTGLILEIFGARAQTNEGRLQVEMAHLQYQRSRLVRSWTHLERQRGGFGFLGGPGETQIEADRRALDDRIARLRRDLARVARTRGQHRQARSRRAQPTVALVGYTNAGKSTLFNALTGEALLAEDMVFATLDTTMRAIALPGGSEAVLSDTVGFISDLPTQLVAAFRATLEDVQDADLVLHVRDMAHPECELQAESVAEVLAEIGVETADNPALVEVWNKIDLLSPDARKTAENLAARRDDVVPVSAATGQGLDALLGMIEARLITRTCDETLRLAFSQTRERAWLFAHHLVTSERQTETGFELGVRWSDRERGRYLSLT